MKISDTAKSYLVEEGYDPEYGARPLRRVIQRHVEDPLSDMLLASPLQAGSIIIDLNNDKDGIKIDIDKKEIPTIETQEPADVVT